MLLQVAYLTPAVCCLRNWRGYVWECVYKWGSGEISSISPASRTNQPPWEHIPEQAEGPWKHATGSKRSVLEKMGSYEGDPPVFITPAKWLYSVQPPVVWGGGEEWDEENSFWKSVLKILQPFKSRSQAHPWKVLEQEYHHCM